MANGNEICRMDAVTLAAKVRAKELSPVEVIEASIARMDKLEPLLRAFCTPGPDLARKAAKQLEADIMAGKDPGPLAGVPIGVKDLICTKDLPTVSGSFAYKDFNGGVDDVVVERLRAAGAIVTGKTNVPEFGY
ncbi:MAG: amidase, partial [Alphaproteobacteria bacterium]|nr:amidase [Alphaproteobacteria bacterium]